MDRTANTFYREGGIYTMSTSDSFSGAGTVTRSLLVSLLVEHSEEKERESKVDVDDGAIVKGDEFELEVEESRAPLRLRQVVGPTVREHAEHDRLHLPCRSMCLVCITGRGANHGHRTVHDELGEQAPGVSFDYCFFRDQRGGLSTCAGGL